MSDVVFVYTMTQLGQVGAWSRYLFPWAISDFAQLGDHLYVRHGDTVSIVDESALTDEVEGEGDPTTFLPMQDTPSVDGRQTGIALNDVLLAVVSTDEAPYLSLYDRDGSTFTAALLGDTLGSASVAASVAITPDGAFVARGRNGGTPALEVLARDAYGTYNLLSLAAPGVAVHGVAWSDDGTYLAVAHNDSSGMVSVYKRSGTTLTLLTTLPGTSGSPLATCVAWAGSDLIAGFQVSGVSGGGIRVWRRVGDAFSAVTLTGTSLTGSGSAVNALAASPNHVAVGCGWYGTPVVAMFTRGTSYARIANLTAGGDEVNALGFSADGTILAATINAAPYLLTWQLDGGTFTAFDHGETVTTNPESLSFAADTLALAQTDADPLLFTWGGAVDVGENEYEGVLHWPWLDFGRPGVNKMLVGFDHVGTGTARIEIGYDQSNLATFTPEYTIPADSMPGTMHPMPVCAPTLSVRITFDGNQDWTWYQTTLYLSDTGMGKP